MKTLVFTLFAFVGSAVLAQQPTPPPPPDVAPAPLPDEGAKELQPKNARGKHVAPKPLKTKTRRPPVTPPQGAEPTAPDQPQDGIH